MTDHAIGGYRWKGENGSRVRVWDSVCGAVVGSTELGAAFWDLGAELPEMIDCRRCLEALIGRELQRIQQSAKNIEALRTRLRGIPIARGLEQARKGGASCGR